jgi:hypothetical protein
VDPINANRPGQPSAYSQATLGQGKPLDDFDALFRRFSTPAPRPRVAPESPGEARTKQTERELACWVTKLLDEAESADTHRNDPLDLRLMVAAERLRQLGGPGARVSVILTMVDRERFDELEFVGQTKTECEHHGVRVKALFSPLWRLLVLHATEPPNF